MTGAFAWRLLREGRDPARGRMPDLVGAVLLVAGVAALSLGVVEGGDRGWTSPGVLGALGVAAASLAWFARRSTRHPAPVVEPALLRKAPARTANAGVFLVSMAFFSLLLASALFFAEVWGDTVLEAGLAFAPGPLMVALLSGPVGANVGTAGPRLVLAGVAVFCAGCLWFAWRLDADGAYLVDALPGLVAGGVGVALISPVLAGTAVSGLPPERTATGSAVFNTARQLGGVVGVACLVAILGSTAPGAADFRAGWLFMAGACLAAGGAGLALPDRPARAASAVPSHVRPETAQ